MNLSRFFINRPIFASVISITIIIAGLMAVRGLPVAQYPEIAPPTVIISANYPGASAETLTRTVAAPIEEQLSGVENLLYFNSTAASNGSLTITATFEVGTNIDIATVNVNNLADARYFTPDADTYANLGALPGLGRTWRLTLKRSF